MTCYPPPPNDRAQKADRRTGEQTNRQTVNNTGYWQ